MKKLGIILFSLILPFMCFAQMRDYVCTVKQVYSDGTNSVVDGFADYFQRNGYPKTAEGLRKQKNSGFGSGFVYVAEDGTNYIITNRHVVELAKECSVTFVNRKGKETTYEHLSIFAMSQDFDIAILKFPEGEKPFKKGLVISNTEVYDGNEVWSVGFPALGGKPSWQFAHGNVTNDYLVQETLVSEEITALIQHSAPIDGGSSGGPLLIKNSKYASGYEVVGINTWKAYGRTNVGLAIPGKIINNFIKDSIENQKLSNEQITELVSKKSKEFVEIISKQDAKYNDVLNFVSMKALDFFGLDFFEMMCKKYQAERLNKIADIFVNDSIVNAMRYSVSFVLYDEMTSAKKNLIVDNFEISEPVFVQASEYSDAGDHWEVTVSVKNQKGVEIFSEKLYFCYESQGVRIYYTDGLGSFKRTGKFNTTKGKGNYYSSFGGVSFKAPYQIELGVFKPFALSTGNFNFMVKFDGFLNNIDYVKEPNVYWTVLGGAINPNGNLISVKVVDYGYGTPYVTVDTFGFAMGTGLGLCYPVTFGSFSVIPYVEFDAIVGVNIDGPQFVPYGEFGVKGAYRTSSMLCIIANAAMYVDMPMNNKVLDYGFVVGINLGLGD